jgi:type VI protein secretion system component VasK
MILGLLFCIFFALINFALVKTLKNKGTSSIISFCVSLLAVYGINRTNLSLSGFFTKIGLSNTLIYSVVPILIIIGLIYMIWKLKLSKTLMLVGIFLVIISFTPIIYTKSTVMIIGIVLFILGLIFWIMKKRRDRKKGTTTGDKPKENKPQGPSESEGKSKLKDAAKKFNSWARSQPNPKFVGSWANFIHWLGKGGWGGSEAEICARLGISQADFVNIFNSYGLVN